MLRQAVDKRAQDCLVKLKIAVSCSGMGGEFDDFAFDSFWRDGPELGGAPTRSVGRDQAAAWAGN